MSPICLGSVGLDRSVGCFSRHSVDWSVDVFFSDGLFGLWSVFKIGQSLDWSVDPFVGRLVSRSVGRSINPSLDQSIGLSTNHSFSQPV